MPDKPSRVVVSNTTFDLQATLDELERLRESEKKGRQVIQRAYFILAAVPPDKVATSAIEAALKELEPWIPKAQDFGPWGM